MKFVLLFLIVFSLLATGCPQQSSAIQKAAQGADKLPALTDSVILAVGQAYTAGVVTLAQKDAMVKDLQLVIDGGRTFDAAVKAASKANDTSPATLANLNVLFQAIVKPFLAFGERLNLLSADKAATILAALGAVTSIVVSISLLFTHAGYTSHAQEVLNARYA